MEQLIKDLIKRLTDGYDWEDEFYQTYCCGLNDGDISDWYDSHFDDSVSRGFQTGEQSHAWEMIGELEVILQKVKGE